MERPASGRVKIKPFLATHSRSTADHLFQIRLRHLRFKYVNILDIKQVNSFFEPAVHHNKSRRLAVRIVRAQIESPQHLFARCRRQWLSKYIDRTEQIKIIVSILVQHIHFM